MKQFLAVLLSIIGVSALACSQSEAARSQEPAKVAAVSAPAAAPKEVTASDKTICGLTREGAPDLKGLKLGMTSQQVLAVFPGSDQDVELKVNLARPASPFGVSNFVIRPDKYQSKETFAGISQITFTLLDGRVSSFSASYSGPEWPHVDKFVAKVVKGTNLPPVDAWDEYTGMETQLKILKCTDFEIRVFAGGPGGSLNYVLFGDLAAAKELKDRKEKAAEKATP
jgi:hypothetical protein